MIPEDQILALCNESELLQLAQRQGLGRLKRGIPLPELQAIVKGEIPVRRDHISETMETRRLLEKFIERNWGRLYSQLPQCDGKCTTFPCSEGKHALCLYPNKAKIQ